jgi:hypothetical protein
VLHTMAIASRGFHTNFPQKDKVEVLKYTTHGFCISLKRKVCPLKASLDFG